ncbi:MAG: helix-turn-helix transcriptional regulator, partial [Candidatus Odyssella sp.]|nr:helix-turn-helix transcriptional regulator [Candidatus Odyssella sp.]
MRDGSETKERIENAALTLFVKRGIAETSIRQIAKTAKVSLGAMYNHYKSKDELAEVLFAELFH